MNRFNRYQQSLNEILRLQKTFPKKRFVGSQARKNGRFCKYFHILSKAVPYWLGEVERVVAEPGSSWGRGLQDPARLAAVTDVDKLSVMDVLAEVGNLDQKVASGLQGLDAETLKQRITTS